MRDAAQTPARRMTADFAPKMVSLADEILFGDIWTREELPRRDRCTARGAVSQTRSRTRRRDGARARCALVRSASTAG
jgi:4-carboxymuconolactone decarboxylase